MVDFNWKIDIIVYMKYQYYTHRNNFETTLYRFPIGLVTDGQFIRKGVSWSASLGVKRHSPKNWTDLRRDEARRIYPFAFSKVKAVKIKEIGDGLKGISLDLGVQSRKCGLKLKDNPFKTTVEHFAWWKMGFELEDAAEE